MTPLRFIIFFFFNDTATTEIYTLSLHDALPISSYPWEHQVGHSQGWSPAVYRAPQTCKPQERSEERFSRNAETDLVCRLLLEKKKIHLLTRKSLINYTTYTSVNTTQCL